jgi:hypothetical protein
MTADGKGKKSTVLAAFAEVLALLEQGKKVAVLNLSFVMNNGQAPPDPAEVKTTCDLLKKIASYGVSISAAAGEQPVCPGTWHSVSCISAALEMQCSWCVFASSVLWMELYQQQRLQVRSICPGACCLVLDTQSV